MSVLFLQFVGFFAVVGFGFVIVSRL